MQINLHDNQIDGAIKVLKNDRELKKKLFDACDVALLGALAPCVLTAEIPDMENVVSNMCLIEARFEFPQEEDVEEQSPLFRALDDEQLVRDFASKTAAKYDKLFMRALAALPIQPIIYTELTADVLRKARGEWPRGNLKALTSFGPEHHIFNDPAISDLDIEFHTNAFRFAEARLYGANDEEIIIFGADSGAIEELKTIGHTDFVATYRRRIVLDATKIVRLVHKLENKQ